MRQPLYTAESDPYCYPNSDVLKNKAGLTTVEALAQFETAMTFARSEEPLPSGRCSVRHYRSIHKHLFQDVYEWAGRFRSVRLTKGSSTFCYPENIAAEMSRIFAWLRQRHPSVSGRQWPHAIDVPCRPGRSGRPCHSSRPARSRRHAGRHDPQLPRGRKFIGCARRAACELTGCLPPRTRPVRFPPLFRDRRCNIELQC